MKQPMRTRSRRCPPKIVGNTARTPQLLRSIGSLSLRDRPGATPPAGLPGVRNFPRARAAAGPGECHRSVAVAKFLARRAAAERAARRADALAEARKGKGRRKATPAWSGRPVQEAPELAHSPAAARPAAPPVRDVPARAHDLPAFTAARRNAFMRREHARVQPARPRPSRVLAEIVAEITAAANA